MFPSLNFGLAGISEPDFEKKLRLAKESGFTHIESSAEEVQALGTDTVNALLEKHGIAISGANLPFHPTQLDEAAFEAALKKLPEDAAALAAVHCTRCIIWIFPASDTMPFAENYALHERRLSAVAKVLAAHGIRLGLEFIGPATGRAKRYAFLHTAEEMLRLAKACGENVGLLFDAWHWHTGAGNLDVFDHIDAAHIVSVHVNDAPDGDIRSMPDSPRALPGETGNIDIAYVMQSLKRLGYDGPVVAEPFSPKLAALPDDLARAKCIKACIDKIWP